MPEAGRLICASRAFMVLCAHWASLQREFHLPERRLYKLFDRLSMVWSLVILITCGYKYFNTPSERASLAEESEPARDWKSIDLLTLNYLPQILAFASLYYGLVMLSIGMALIWRLYLIFFRRTGGSQQMFVRRAARKVSASSSSVFIDTSLECNALAGDGGGSEREGTFDAKLEVISFFMEGPREDSLSTAASERRTEELIELHFTRNFTHLECAESPCGCNDNDSADTSRRTSLGSRYRESRAGLLRRAHGESTATSTNWVQTYQVPIRSVDLFEDKSAERWRELACYVYALVTFVLVVSLPLIFMAVSGLTRLIERFGPSQRGQEPDGATNWLGQRQFVSFIRIYGLVEQTYAMSQLALFFIFTNIFIMLFYADLMRRVRPILGELEQARNQFSSGQLDSMPVRQLHRFQLRIWCYFDQMEQLDGFVSRYALISLAQLAIGLTLSLSFVKLDEPRLKRATFAAAASNSMSFAYLYLVSEHVQRTSYRMHRLILGIVAAEREPLIKREWQRLLRAFFQSKRKRTFTINGRYPVNMRTFAKVVTALSAICMLVHRLFHRDKWNEPFLGALRANTAGLPV